MMTLSPFSRRILALSLLVLISLFVVNLIALPLSSLVRNNLNTLEDARFRLERLEALDARPASELGIAIPPGYPVQGPSHEKAMESFLGVLVATASTYGLKLEPPVGAPQDQKTPLILAADIILVGDDIGIMKFIHSLENGQPAVRLVRWKISATESAAGGTRLEARASSVWADRS